MHAVPKLRLGRPLVLLCFSLVCWHPANAAQAPGAQEFGALPAQSQPALSPDGRLIAWIEHGDSPDRAVALEVATRKVLRTFLGPENSELRTLRWHDDETLLIGVTTPGMASNRVRILAFDVNTGQGHVVLSEFNYLVAWSTSKPHTMIVATDSGGYTETKLLEVDVRTGKSSVIREGGKFTVKWVVSRDGIPLAREDWEWIAGQYRVYALEGKVKRELLSRDDSQRPQVGGVLADGRSLLLLADNGRGHQAAWALPLDGSPLQLLAEDPGADITDVFTDPYTQAVVGVFVGGAEGAVHWLGPAANARYESLARAFPSRTVELYAWSEDGNRILARVSSASAPPIHYLTDLTTHRADIAAEEYPVLSGATLGTVTEIHYKARDGTDLLAYLTLPPGKSAPLPLILLPHEAHRRDYPRFDPLVQFLATRGYLVLQPQFRGSAGFGDAFRDAGDRQWGRLMQDDLTDAVQAVVAQGLADPRRVCILGTSQYSGYAALAGAAFTPDLYACAASINGLSDLAEVMSEGLSGPFRRVSTTQSEWKKLLGSVGEAERVSPINAVQSIKTPILIMYGADAHTRIAQSQTMARALSRAGKSVTVVTLPMDMEWTLRTRTRVQVFSELERFLGQHLPAN